MPKKYILKAAILLFLTLIVGFSSCGKLGENEFVVKGKLSNVTDTSFIVARELRDTLVIDTISINKNGEFAIRGTVDTLTVMSLYFNGNTKYSFLFVDKGWTVEVDGDVLYTDLMKVKGGDINEDLAAFKKENENLLKKRTDILNAVEQDDFVSGEIGKDHAVELKNINFELSNIAANYVKANPTKIASVMLINTFFKEETTIPRLDESLGLLRGQAARFPLVRDLQEYSSRIKKSMEGASAPYFSLEDVNKKQKNLYEFKGKYVLLSFASTTCSLCDTERDLAIPIYNEFKKNKENIEFVSIVINTERKEIPKEIKRNVKWTLLPESGGWSSSILDAYNVNSLPYNILLSPEGAIIARDVQIQMLPTKLKELTAKKD